MSSNQPPSHLIERIINPFSLCAPHRPNDLEEIFIIYTRAKKIYIKSLTTISDEQISAKWEQLSKSFNLVFVTFFLIC